MNVEHGDVEVDGVRLHTAHRGSGPLALLLHGFPEGRYSWRHRCDAPAAAGYRVVAPGRRGHGRSDRPEEVSSYTLPHLAGASGDDPCADGPRARDPVGAPRGGQRGPAGLPRRPRAADRAPAPRTGRGGRPQEA